MNSASALLKKSLTEDSLIRDGGETLELGAFTLARTGLTVRGKPSFDEWQRCGAFLKRIEGAVQWWIGDWLNYGEQRYGEKYSQALDATDLDYQTLRDYAWVALKVELSLRKDNLSYSIHKEVASLPSPQQAAVLQRAADEQLTVTQVRALVRTIAHQGKVAAIIAGRLPSGVYDVICADPPWQYDNSGFHQSAAAHYPAMDDDAIGALPATDQTFPKFADPSVLFLWATSPRLPSAHAVMAAWGFDYKACMVWVKDRAPGLGWWLQTRHELLLIGAKGSSTPQERIDSVVEAAVGDHSRKPDEAYAAIERMFPGLRRVEVFARGARPGWDAWGNEA